MNTAGDQSPALAAAIAQCRSDLAVLRVQRVRVAKSHAAGPAQPTPGANPSESLGPGRGDGDSAHASSDADIAAAVKSCGDTAALVKRLQCKDAAAAVRVLATQAALQRMVAQQRETLEDELAAKLAKLSSPTGAPRDAAVPSWEHKAVVGTSASAQGSSVRPSLLRLVDRAVDIRPLHDSTSLTRRGSALGLPPLASPRRDSSAGSTASSPRLTPTRPHKPSAVSPLTVSPRSRSATPSDRAAAVRNAFLHDEAMVQRLLCNDKALLGIAQTLVARAAAIADATGFGDTNFVAQSVPGGGVGRLTRPASLASGQARLLRKKQESSGGGGKELDSVKSQLAKARKDLTKVRKQLADREAQAIEQGKDVVALRKAVAKADAAQKVADAAKQAAVARAAAAHSATEDACTRATALQAQLDAAKASWEQQLAEVTTAADALGAQLKQGAEALGDAHIASRDMREHLLTTVRECFDAAASGVNGNGCTAYDVFQRLRQALHEHLDACPAQQESWGSTSAHVAKVAAESWLNDVQESEAQGLRDEVERLRAALAELSKDVVDAEAGEVGVRAATGGDKTGSGATMVDGGAASDGGDRGDLVGAPGPTPHKPRCDMNHEAEIATLHAQAEAAAKAAAEEREAHERHTEELQASMRAAVLEALEMRKVAAAAKTEAMRAQTETTSLRNKLSNAGTVKDLRKKKLMEELADARQQVRLLKGQVKRLEQQLMLAEKQVKQAMEAHLPEPGDSYDDSFEAVLREELSMMRAAFELKIELLTKENNDIVRAQRKEIRELTAKFGRGF